MVRLEHASKYTCTRSIQVKKIQAKGIKIQAKIASVKMEKIWSLWLTMARSNNPRNYPQADITAQYELLKWLAKIQAEVCCNKIDVGRVEYTVTS